ncbi:MAG: histidinol-phosphatase [Thermoproteota archaeon]|nr:histidinol-phosphatase [Candidatus Brockarchaeota archaeon]
MKINYHIHTTFSDGSSRMSDYCEAAVRKGFEEIAFTDHLTVFPNGSSSTGSLDWLRLESYVEEARMVSEKYGGKLTVRLGLEVDYIPGNEKILEDMLDSYDFDFLMGSVHFVGGICIDSPSHRILVEKEIGKNGFNKFYSAYMRLVGKAVETGLFNVVSHIDIVRIWGFTPSDGFLDEQNVLRLVKQHGMCIEVSSRGLRQPVNSIYPSQRIMRKTRELEISLTVGTDAHSVEEIDYAYDSLINYVKAFGYDSIATISKRRIMERKFE